MRPDDFITKVNEDTGSGNDPELLPVLVDIANSSNEHLLVSFDVGLSWASFSAALIREIEYTGVRLNSVATAGLRINKESCSLTQPKRRGGEPHYRDIRILDFPNPPGGPENLLPAVEFEATTTSPVRVACYFGMQPPAPYKPLERLVVLCKNHVYENYLTYLNFTDDHASGTADLGSHNYWYTVACFHRRKNLDKAWGISQPSNIVTNGNQFVFIFTDEQITGGITGGNITISSSVTLTFS